MKKSLVIFGMGDLAQLAHYYFDADSEYETVAFTADSDYIKDPLFCGLPVVAFEDIFDTEQSHCNRNDIDRRSSHVFFAKSAWNFLFFSLEM